ncbi:MAG: hypothetical protein AAFO94_09850 [Bacteroidota bacterium]
MFDYTFSFYLIFILAAVVIAFFIAPMFKRGKKKANDPRSNLTPNDTNYNKANTLPKEVVEEASAKEAAEIIRKEQQSDTSSLSNDDFYRLKEKVDGSSRNS